MAGKQIHSGHRARLRERALNEGLDNFNPHQVLELLLFYAIPRQDTSEAAHLLLEQFGSVSAVLNAPIGELTKIRGIGNRAAQWLHSIGMLMQTYIDLRPSDRVNVSNYQSVLRVCGSAEGLYAPPKSYLMCISPHGTVLTFGHLCDSTAWDEPDSLKRGLDDLLSVKARYAVVVEFVEGEPAVSEDDSKRVKEFGCILRMIGAELLDLVKIGHGAQLSLRQTGVFPSEGVQKEASYLSEHYLEEDAWESINEMNPEEDEES